MEEKENQSAPETNVEIKHIGGRVVEVKKSQRNDVPVGIIEGYIATWDIDSGGFFGVPDRFVPGAFTESLQEHRNRGNRQIRFKDHHGRTVGGFPIESVIQDDVGLFGIGEINLEVQQGADAYSLARQKVLTDFSIGFSVPEGGDRLEDGVRVITKATVWEGSIVDEPANQNAIITEVKSKLSKVQVKSLTPRELEEMLREGSAFSRDAAVFIASCVSEELAEVKKPLYDSEGLSRLLKDLNSTLDNLRGN